jgi:hypothetical protein
MSEFQSEAKARRADERERNLRIKGAKRQQRLARYNNETRTCFERLKMRRQVLRDKAEAGDRRKLRNLGDSDAKILMTQKTKRRVVMKLDCAPPPPYPYSVRENVEIQGRRHSKSTEQVVVHTFRMVISSVAILLSHTNCV